MNIIEKILSFKDEDDSIIGLCRFNDDFFEDKKQTKKLKPRYKKEATLSEILKRSY